MNNYIQPSSPCSLTGSYFPPLSFNPDPYFEISAVQDRVQLVAESAIHNDEDSFVKPFADLKSRPNPYEKRPKSDRFTLKEDIEIFNSRVSKMTFRSLEKKLKGKSEAEISNRWEYLLQLNPDLKDKVEIARLSQIKSKQVGLGKDPMQPSKQNKQYKRPFGQYELVFSTPNSLGPVFIEKDHSKLFSEFEDDQLIIGKINNETAQKIAERLDKRLDRVHLRWSQLKGRNQHLETTVEIARLEKVRLLCLKPVKPVDPEVCPLEEDQDSKKFKVNLLEAPVQPSKRKSKITYVDYRLGFMALNQCEEIIIKIHQVKRFSEIEDQEVISGKLNGKTSTDIAERLTGKTPRHIQDRWRVLMAPNPELKKIINKPIGEQVQFLYLKQENPAAEYDPLSFLQQPFEPIMVSDCPSTNGD